MSEADRIRAGFSDCTLVLSDGYVKVGFYPQSLDLILIIGNALVRSYRCCVSMFYTFYGST